jgi:hypothetical protein
MRYRLAKPAYLSAKRIMMDADLSSARSREPLANGEGPSLQCQSSPQHASTQRQSTLVLPMIFTPGRGAGGKFKGHCLS